MAYFVDMHDISLRRLVILALVLLIAVPCFAAPYDRVIVGNSVFGCHILPFISPRIEWHPFWADDPTDIFTVAAAPGERVLAALSGARIEIVELKADQSRTPFFSGADGYYAASLAVASSGDVHVLAWGPNAAIISISPSGALVATHSLGFALEPYEYAFDLASDQCTTAIGAGGVIHRFNVCTGTALPDLVSTYAVDLAFLPDGDVLASSDLGLRRYDSSGVLVNTIDVDDYPGTIALRSQGNSAIVETGCESGQLVHVDLITEATSDAGTTEVTQARAILLSDGWTAALGPASLERVPTLSNTIAIVFAALLALAALRRMS
jgi:hypothetical protein